MTSGACTRSLAFVVLASVMLLASCASRYKVNADVSPMSEAEAGQYLVDLTQSSPQWICAAGTGPYGLGTIERVALDDGALQIDVRNTHSQLAIVEANTVTGSFSKGLNQVVDHDTYRVHFGELTGMRIFSGTSPYRCRDDATRWVALKDSAGVTVVVSPPAAEFERALGALQTLNPDVKIKTGIGL